jgi:glutamate-1-semialdehyde aminotransferase
MSQTSKQTLSRSASLYQRALAVMPGGCSRNTVLRKPHPLYAVHGEDALRKDFLDFALGNGILLVSTCTGLLSTAMTSKEVDHLAAVTEGAFKKIRPALRAINAA